MSHIREFGHRVTMGFAYGLGFSIALVTVYVGASSRARRFGLISTVLKVKWLINAWGTFRACLKPEPRVDFG